MDTPNTESAYAGAPVVQSIPTAVVSSGLLSEHTYASDCFINQRFSKYLQAFLVSYVNQVYGNYPSLGT